MNFRIILYYITLHYTVSISFVLRISLSLCTLTRTYPFFLPSFLGFLPWLIYFLPSLASFLPAFLSYILPQFLPSFLPSCLPSLLLFFPFSLTVFYVIYYYFNVLDWKRGVVAVISYS